MENYLILHGHFYQPPRENPYTGLVPLQSSAAPFHDWNHRITRECYAANTASRFLHYDGRIEDIVNNYEVLSFNFGPTLFAWLRAHAPHVYEAIIEADRSSQDNNEGHGNAIAQAYNHTILPLDTVKDARLQIRWGLDDFRFHFDRDAEGMWLPETAVNGEVLDLLINEGVHFIILSPRQAKALKADGSKEWEQLDGAPIPSWRPYRIDRPGGSIAVFFYHHELAEGISFGHYLQNADALYTRLLSFRNTANPAHLIHTATDGEVYGHHEPFGDMCLAALRKHVQREEKLCFTNYSRYLDHYPPEHQVELHPGEGKLGSSWSCVHGVSRWFKDCGCATGGEEHWNQKWRTPLRRGFRELSEKSREIFDRELRKLTSIEPEQVAERYIDVLTGTSSHEKFAAAYIEAPDEKRQRHFFNLLEGFRYRMFMFTSCGWFFNDISGLEPQQNIQYAYKTLSLFQPYTEEHLYNSLSAHLQQAHSNLPEIESGAQLLEQAIPQLSAGLEAATYYFIKLLIQNTIPKSESYGFYQLIDSHVYSRGDNKEASARFTVLDSSTRNRYSYAFTASTDSDEELQLQVQDENRGGQRFVEDLSRLPVELRRTITAFLIRPAENSFLENAAELFEEVRFAVVQTERLQIQVPEIIRKSAELSLDTLLRRLIFQKKQLLQPNRVEELEDLLTFATTYGIDFENKELRETLNRFFREYFEEHEGKAAPPKSELIARVIRAVTGAAIKLDLTIPQKHMFSGIRYWRYRVSGSTELGFPRSEGREQHTYRELPKEEREALRRSVELADSMGIYADDLKALVFSPA